MVPTLIVIAVVLVVLVGWAVATYNGLVQLRNRVDNSLGQIEVQLKRRFDLIPNIVETVKGYAAHEKETFERVVAARNAGLSASTPGEQAAADNLLTGALRQLFALAEAYPELKANQNFLELQAQLEETENKVAISRQIYNDTVLSYNNKVHMVPSNIVASLAGFKAREFFDAPSNADEAPQVSF